MTLPSVFSLSLSDGNTVLPPISLYYQGAWPVYGFTKGIPHSHPLSSAALTQHLWQSLTFLKQASFPFP